ncbi:MAG: nucleotide sugar dehydrogenase, partial [Bdellovibrionota bacterium]
AVNIGLVNEVALMCEKLGIDCWEVIEAASTKPFGYMPFYPGPGLGGHCIPIDPSYLSWKLRGLNYTARFIELANAVNTSMPRFCVDKAMLALNKDKKSINGARILVMGVAYKKDIDDMRESPALDLIHLLQNLGAEVSYYDPFVPEVNYDGLNLRSLNWKKDVAADFDLTIIATDHSQIDYQALVHSSQRVLDTRNATKGIFSEKVVKL